MKISISLRPKKWLFCAHCKEDYKNSKGTGTMTCKKCMKKGLKDDDAIKVAEKISSILKRNEMDREIQALTNDIDDPIAYKIRQSLPRKLLTNKKLMDQIRMLSEVLDVWHKDSHIENKLIIDLKHNMKHEELDDTSINKLIDPLLTEIRIKSIEHGIVLIQSGADSEYIGRLKDKLQMRLPNSQIRFIVLKPYCPHHTSVTALFFGKFDFPIEDDFQ